jgi:hypothetical protein
MLLWARAALDVHASSASSSVARAILSFGCGRLPGCGGLPGLAVFRCVAFAGGERPGGVLYKLPVTPRDPTGVPFELGFGVFGGRGSHGGVHRRQYRPPALCSSESTLSGAGGARHRCWAGCSPAPAGQLPPSHAGSAVTAADAVGLHAAQTQPPSAWQPAVGPNSAMQPGAADGRILGSLLPHLLPCCWQQQQRPGGGAGRCCSCCRRRTSLQHEQRWSPCCHGALATSVIDHGVEVGGLYINGTVHLTYTTA